MRAILCLALALFCAACSPTAATRTATGINDPNERGNRQIHAFNRGLDRAFVAPFRRDGDGNGGGGARPLRQGLINVVDNLDAPRDMLNGTLQGRPDTVISEFFRFAINSTVGVAGLFDPATSIGVTAKDTDFGETLHVWGVGEGIYVELPFFGPSTMRDSVGFIVDILINPIRPFLDTPQNRTLTVVNTAGEIADLSRYSGTLGDIYDTSADSYAQLRLIYLQNRRFELARNAEARRRGSARLAPADTFADDPYGDGGAVLDDPYAAAPESVAISPPAETLATDPYEDPYAP